MLPFPDNHILTNHISAFMKRFNIRGSHFVQYKEYLDSGSPVVNHHALSNGDQIPAGTGEAKAKSGGDGDDGNNDDHHVRLLLHLA